MKTAHKNFGFVPNIILNNGVAMPMIGLGVWQMKNGRETEQSINWALAAGYRLIDTATYYGNEESVGKAVRQSDIPRSEIFVTTKIWPTDFMDVRKAFEQSLNKLALDYVDLYLIHHPIPIFIKQVWKELEKLYEEKLVRAIGISNFSTNQTKKILDDFPVPPAVNQVRFNPFSHDDELLEFCRSKKIAVEAYTPLSRARQLDNPLLVRLAQKYGKSPAQIILRWSLDQNVIIIPKSSDQNRIRENIDILDFNLSLNDLEEIGKLQ